MVQVYCDVLASVRRWIVEKQQGFPACIKTRFIIDSADVLRVQLETPLRIAEVLVSDENDFAPYRWISFQIVDLRSKAAETPLFCYFDSPQDSLNEILQQLNLGMSILLEGVDS